MEGVLSRCRTDVGCEVTYERSSGRLQSLRNIMARKSSMLGVLRNSSWAPQLFLVFRKYGEIFNLGSPVLGMCIG
jgi:hypothetical protein